MLTCRDVTRLCASEDIRRAPFARRVAVRLHLLMCRHCCRYVRELSAIGAASRRAFASSNVDNFKRIALEERLIAEIRRVRSSDTRTPDVRE